MSDASEHVCKTSDPLSEKSAFLSNITKQHGICLNEAVLFSKEWWPTISTANLEEQFFSLNDSS